MVAARKQQEEKQELQALRDGGQKTLEIEQVEDLKDRLHRHMQEIKRLFGEAGSSLDNGSQDEEAGDNGQGNDEDEEEFDAELANKKLIDQILRLKLLINENRRALEGDNLDD